MPYRMVVMLAFAPAVLLAQTPLTRASWLAGCWELRAPNRVTLEMWMPALGDMMLGSSRTTLGARTSEFEMLRLKVEGDRLHYIAMPNGRNETSFPSIELSDSLLIFENTAHDFPQRIIYRKRGADSIIARIEGPGPNGPRGSNFPFRRGSCLTVAPPAPPDTFLVGADLSRDGRHLLVARGTNPDIDVYLFDANGQPLQRLTETPNFDYQPRWSPDGRRIVFVGVRGRMQQIYTMNGDGSNVAELTSGSQNSDPWWSPDGRRIVFRSDRDGNGDIFVMNADGTDQRALTSEQRNEGFPAWSPDGRQILFTATVDGRVHLFIMNADGSGQRQLTQSPTGHTRAGSWSPDGKHIVFNTTRDGNDELYVMTADGSNARNITNHPAADIPIGWTRDGYILFLSTRDRAARDIYRMRPDGSGVTRVTTTR